MNECLKQDVADRQQSTSIWHQQNHDGNLPLYRHKLRADYHKGLGLIKPDMGKLDDWKIYKYGD